MNFKPGLLAAAAFFAVQAHATVVAQWDYNSGSMKHSLSQNGASTSLLGGVTSSFVSQSGSSDPSAGQALNTAGYGSATTGNLTRGIQFGVDTTGYDKLVLTFDQRNSATASAWTALLYTVDGENWSQATTFQMLVDGSFVKGRTFDFSSIAGVANNEAFAFQLVSMFAPGTSSYQGTANNYASGGTIRYDMVTLSGTELVVVAPAVPEPATLALMLAGLGAVGLSARRRTQRA